MAAGDITVEGLEALAAALIRGLDEQLRRDGRALERVVLREVAERVQAGAVRGTDAVRAVDRGSLKRAWRRQRIPGGWAVYNPTRYAAVLELGRRPGARPPPYAAIAEWVRRKLVLGEGRFGGKIRRNRRSARAHARLAEQNAEVLRAAFFIRQAIAKRGIRPRFILRDALLPVDRYLADAVRLHLPARPSVPGGTE